MGRRAKPTPERKCKACGNLIPRLVKNGRIQELAHYLKKVYCNRACMAQGMQKEICRSLSHSHSKAARTVKPACEACGKKGRLHVHHIDEDPTNNTPSNLKTLCSSCHRRSHSPNFMADGVTRKRCKHCAQPSVRRGLCSSHLNRFRRHGDPLAVKIRKGSGWVLDTSGLPVRSRRSQKGRQPGSPA